MYKKTVILSSITVVVCVAILMIFFHDYDSGTAKSTETSVNPKEVVIPEVDLNKIDDMVIGSEPPKLIYADKVKVLFETTGGVYVYVLNDKSLIRSFDISSFASERYANVYESSFVTQDGKQLIFHFSKESGEFVAAYRYSLEDKAINELTEKESIDYREERFETKYPDPSDELYQKSSGIIATISGREYVYLTFQDWKVNTINVVYVQDDKETVYSVFNNK